MAKSKIGYLLLDLPGAHEIEKGLSTECEVIESLINNRGSGSRVKRIRIASIEGFGERSFNSNEVQFVHLACHANGNDIGFFQGGMAWRKVAERIRQYLRPLKAGSQRVMVFSCCHSAEGFVETKTEFAEYFSGAYYFCNEEVDFSTAITTWAMFYLVKRIKKPHRAIVADINRFFDRKILVFREYKR